MKKFFSFILFLALALIAVFPLGGCFDEETERFPELEINQNVTIESKHISVKPTWSYSKSKSGYYEAITLKVKVNGYSELTYYNVEVVVTFTATLITDDCPVGETFTQTVVCAVNNKGDGQKVVVFPLTGCRAINSKTTQKVFTGTVTKIG